MSAPIILIGPAKSGKSTVAGLLSRQTDWPIHSTDDFGLAELESFGYDKDTGERVWNEEGATAYYRYCQPVYLKGIEKLLDGAADCIIELDSVTSIYEDEELATRLQTLLAPQPNVVLIAPNADLTASARILRERDTQRMQGWHDLNDLFLENESNERLAKITVYTKDRNPEQSRDEILSKLSQTTPNDVILLGPISTGKSTLGHLLAERLGKKQASLDAFCWDYYKEIGYQENIANDIKITQGPSAWWRYMQHYNPHALERLLTEHAGSIFDLGGGHSVYDDPALLDRVQNLLAPYPNVLLILPSSDRAESSRVLRARADKEYEALYDLHEHLALLPSGCQPAKFTVYTEGYTPEQTARQVWDAVAEGFEE